ncbi:hypothetical protein GCM10011506_47800 [Marivirga lumbricoides]|uniref:Uncharacterized protein n=1 Tax=Marivirga lumbricoides TaxID=1046115 RepID=A0ABQ1N707_9BACT|nr:hypothetical protein GCM10011506_47800 [Marivirga lumbricoides]
MKAQEKTKQKLVTSEVRDNEKLKNDIEKELEHEDFLEADHEQMHKEDKIALKKVNDKKSPDEDFKKRIQQVRSEKAKEKLLKAHQNMEQARNILLKTEEKIAQAKEKLADPAYTKNFTAEELQKKEANLNKAIELLTKARENHQIYNAQIDKKVNEIQEKHPEI